jgi:hypothetical protein
MAEQITLPFDSTSLAAWFAEGVRAELAALEKSGGTQTYEVQSGELIETKGPNQGVFLFIIADGTRIPEDATGRLTTENDEFTATVIWQQGNLLHLHLEGKSLPPNIHWARLTIDDTALLQKLAQILEELTNNSQHLTPLATTVFHPSKAVVSFTSLPNTPSLVEISGELRRILEQACGSSVTYVWGPPGTGKTHAIAHLITALIESGERILVASHTKAAVDQALYEAVKNENGKCGPLAENIAVNSGRVLRIGITVNRKIPNSVLFDKVLESKGQELQRKILELEKQMQPLLKIMEYGKATISEWDKLAELSYRMNSVKESIEKADLKESRAKEKIKSYKDVISQRGNELEKAQHTWFRRETKTKRARLALEEAELQLKKAEEVLTLAIQDKKKAQQLVISFTDILQRQKKLCATLPAKEVVAKELSEVTLKMNPLQEKLYSLQEELSKLGQSLIDNASAIFCTLTKNYVGKELEGQKFDAVIVDEISMALPPLIFLIAGRAKSRVILVGDFLQLPPIIRSDTPISNARLGTDTFHLAGIVQNQSISSKVLTKLTTQHRMVPAIADVARHLVYNSYGGLYDHEDVKSRKAEKWLDFMPENPLLIIDTADLHCWCGKQPGTLSRFNMYTANVAVDLSALAADRIWKPSSSEPQPIGIITPFAAQRRLLSKLIADIGLDQWVAAGTVHTFQGNQADLIIFDSVLDEPYWASRLTNPNYTKDVLRDLNVAVTRAKNKFIFIGSSEWLNNHARPTSALGQMWNFLRDRADLISALELIGDTFYKHMAGKSNESVGWNIPKTEEGYTLETLNEEAFFGRFTRDINASATSIFALAPYFGEYRWPKIQPLFNTALKRGVKVTIITPPLAEAQNKSYVENVIKNLRNLGAVVVSASGLHGKDVIIDERIVYTGSMNWSSHRGRLEVIHRIDAPQYAKQCLEFIQARHIRQSSFHEDGSPRTCPKCGFPVHIVNQRTQHGMWDFQSMKVGCTNPNCEGYLRNIDERPPFKTVPLCQVDGRTKYRRIRRRRGELWECPKHPKECPSEKVVLGDPA